jgi:butyryl-CoA dehydrogenase
MKNGRALMIYAEEVEKTAAHAQDVERLGERSLQLKEALEKLKSVTMGLMGFAIKGNIDRFLADATLYLELFGQVPIAWQWLLQGLAAQSGLAKEPGGRNADFYAGKLYAMDFFFEYELPKIDGLVRRLTSENTVTLNIRPENF